MAAHGENEWETEFLAVFAVQPLQLVEFGLRALCEARTALLACRFGCQLAAHRRLAGKLGVGIDEGKLALAACTSDSGHHRIVKGIDARERTLRRRLARHPR